MLKLLPIRAALVLDIRKAFSFENSQYTALRCNTAPLPLGGILIFVGHGCVCIVQKGPGYCRPQQTGVR
jgi:hypothetical protein